MYLALLLPVALAAEPDQARPESPRLEIPGLEHADIVIDGVLSEPAWAGAAVVTDLVRWAPSAGPPPPGETRVLLLYDAHKLYVAFEVTDPEPDQLRAHVSPREDINADDQVGLALDPFLDRKSAYALWINPLGIQQDFHDSVTGDFSMAWDAVWQSKGRLTGTGYVVELAIPWKSLPYPRDEVQTWGLTLSRGVARDGTWYAWPALDIDAANVIAQEGELVGLRPPVDRLRLELLPTLTAGQRWSRPSPDAPLQAERAPLELFEPGLDLIYGPSPDLSVQATLNPDFSQVEADPFLMDINIRYALSLEERRPFFLAGYDSFTDPLETLYTRAVVDPRAGAKLTARAGGARLGVLSAYDVAPEGSLVWDRQTPGFTAEEMAGRHAETTVVRAKHDRDEKLQIGAIYAEKDVFDTRDGSPVGLHAWNRVGGADLTATFAERWLVQAELLGSWTGGPERAELAEGTDPRAGSELLVDLERRGSVGWTGQWRIHDVSSGFRAETSYQDRVGYTNLYTKQSWKFQPDDLSEVVPSAEAGLVFDRELSGPPEHWVGAGLDLKPSQKTGCYAGGGHRAELYAGLLFPYATGWGGCWSEPLGWLSVSGDLSGGGTIDYGTAEAARELVGSTALTLRPLSRLLVEASYAHQSVWGAEDPALRYRLNLARLKTNLQFSRSLGLRLIGQYRDDEGVLDASALGTWLWAPGTGAYLGYAETRREDAGFAVHERQVFAKVSALLRL